MDLSSLYQEVILDHNRRPRNFGAMTDPTRTASGHNPLCGDQLTVFLRVANDRIEDIKFEGSGCAISKASASLMTEAVKGRSLADVLGVFERFQSMITTPLDLDAADESLGKLQALAGVRSFPVRIKCASLPWHTLKAALLDSAGTAVTE
jgi:nitrogen fixation NifU-like protein